MRRNGFASGVFLAGRMISLSLGPGPGIRPENGTARLEYRLGRRESRVSLIAGGRRWTASLPAEAMIRRSVSGFIRESSRRTGNLEALERAAGRIAEELIPFRRELTGRGISRIIVASDGIIARLPFEALRFRENGRDGSWMVEHFAFSYASSPPIRPLPEERRNAPGDGLLAIGAGRPGLVRLAAVDSEIAGLTRRFGRARRRLSSGGTALEADFDRHRGGSFEVVHIAAHRRPGRRRDDSGSLALQPGGNEDGFLGPEEIREANLSAELVVLSACRTAGASADAPGLSRFFLEAGARSVVASLWPVADRPTADLMIRFYSRLKSGLGKSDALRAAKRDMIGRGWSHPFFWAGFVLQGEPNGTISFR